MEVSLVISYFVALDAKSAKPDFFLKCSPGETANCFPTVMFTIRRCFLVLTTVLNFGSNYYLRKHILITLIQLYASDSISQKEAMFLNVFSFIFPSKYKYTADL